VREKCFFIQKKLQVFSFRAKIKSIARSARLKGRLANASLHKKARGQDQNPFSRKKPV